MNSFMKQSSFTKFKIFKHCTSCYSADSQQPLNLTKLSYIKQGNSDLINKTLLITHGLLGSKHNWNSICNNLKSKFKQIVSFDLRNHGDSPHSDDITVKSMAEDVKHLIINYGYKDLIFMGHSLGGKVAMRLALAEPQLLSGLVIVDVSPINLFQVNDFQSYINAMISAPIDQNISLTLNRQLIDEHLSKTIENSAIRSFLLMNLIKSESDQGIVWRANLTALSTNINLLYKFPRIPGAVFEKPTLFIAGQESNYIRPEHWPVIKEMFPIATLKTVPGASHWVHADKPHEFMKILVEFARDLH